MKKIKIINFRNLVFSIHKNVYEPAEDTFLLADNFNVCKNDAVLDMGTGCGILAILASKQAKSVDAIDISPYAIKCAKENSEQNGVEKKIRFHIGDLYESDLNKMFDLILFNPPYLPSSNLKKKTWIERAWAGGKNGREVIDRFIEHSRDYLSDRGKVIMVQSSLSNINITLKNLRKAGFLPRIKTILSFPFERIALIEAI